MSEEHATEARRAERAGDLRRAVAHWQAVLRDHPQDAGARLEVGRLLMEVGDVGAARTILLTLDHPSVGAVAPQANRLLARLDEREGMLASASFRWERLQADDVDDPEALRHQRRTRRGEEPAVGTSPPAWLASTLLTPEGVDLQRYRLVRELGRGGNGVVYLAHDERLGCPVALKILHPGASSPRRRAAEARFFAEQKALARLRHPGLVAILALDPTTRSLALEPMMGGSLRAWLREHAQEPWSSRAERAWQITTTLAPALAFVHERGFLHGDIKPGNVLLRQSDGDREDPDGVPALADFGGTTMVEDAERERPNGGTPLYFAPELFAGQAPSPATDVFALGAVGWEILCATPWRSHVDLMAGRYDLRPSLPADLAAHVTTSTAVARVVHTLEALTSPSPALRMAAMAAFDRAARSAGLLPDAGLT